MREKNLVQMRRAAATAGVLSICSYWIIIFTSPPDAVVFLLAMLFPMLGIIFIFGVREWVQYERPSYVNRLAFVFGSFAFCICAIFLSAQLAVQTIRQGPGVSRDVAVFVRESVRMVDLGMDVAWDMFISTYLILFGIAVRDMLQLRWWGVVAALLGISLMVLNVYTFPDPPADAGLFDLGPFIGCYLLALSIRLYNARSTRHYRINHL